MVKVKIENKEELEKLSVKLTEPLPFPLEVEVDLPDGNYWMKPKNDSGSYLLSQDSEGWLVAYLRGKYVILNGYAQNSSRFKINPNRIEKP